MNDPQKMREVMALVQQQSAQAQAEEFVSTVRDKCFLLCVTKPSSSLGSSEQQCLARCCDRYADAVQVVTGAFFEQQGQ